MDLLNALDFVLVGLHTFCAGYCAIKGNLGVLDVALHAVEQEASITGYMHQVEKVVIMLLF